MCKPKKSIQLKKSIRNKIVPNKKSAIGNYTIAKYTNEKKYVNEK